MEQDIFIDTLEDESVAQNLMTEDAAWKAADGKTALDKNLTVSDFCAQYHSFYLKTMERHRRVSKNYLEVMHIKVCFGM